MAYRRGSKGQLSKIKQLKARRKEQRELQSMIDAIEVAKQTEARERERSQMGGLGIGGLVGLLAGWNPAGLALSMAIGQGLGDVGYRSGQFHTSKDHIQEALDALEDFDTTKADLQLSAEQSLAAGEMAQEQIMGGDFTSDILGLGTNFLTYYMTLAGMDKMPKGDKTLFGKTGELGQYFYAG